MSVCFTSCKFKSYSILIEMVISVSKLECYEDLTYVSVFICTSITEMIMSDLTLLYNPQQNF
jgi:hypothetical protein